MRAKLVLGILVMLSGGAQARPNQRDPIPTGKDWSCFVGESQSYCRRTQAECDDIRTQYKAAHTGEQISICKPQKLAAVVTFRVVLKDVRRFVAASTFAMCKDFRATLLAQKDDMSDVSRCEGIGERKSKLQDKVEKGSGFYCQATVSGRKSIGGLYDASCYRRLADCRKYLAQVQSFGTDSDPVEVIRNCDLQDTVYAIATKDGKSINLLPDHCDECDLVW